MGKVWFTLRNYFYAMDLWHETIYEALLHLYNEFKGDLSNVESIYDGNVALHPSEMTEEEIQEVLDKVNEKLFGFCQECDYHTLWKKDEEGYNVCTECNNRFYICDDCELNYASSAYGSNCKNCY